MSDLVRQTLRQALGDGTRSESFEQFLTFSKDIRDQHANAPPDVMRVVRFAELFSIAAVEGATEITGGSPSPEEVVEVIRAMCLGASIALSGAVLSVLRDDTPASALRSIVMHSFEIGLEETIASNGLPD